MSLKPIKLPRPAKSGNFSSIDPLDSRYYDEQIATYLSEQSRIAYQAYIEAALAQTLAEFKICSQKVADEIEAAARQVTAEAVYEEEKTTKHDIKALVNVIKKDISNEAKPFVHYGATSYDIVSTAQSLQMRDAATNLVLPRLNQLLKTLVNLTEKYADTTQIGRTHGQHAVPITFGFAIAEYVQRLGTSAQALNDLSGQLKGKFSGAVGAYNALNVFVDDPVEFEKKLLAKVDLQPAAYSNQIVPPDDLIRLIDELVISSGIMANLAHDMRHLQRSEINEVREAFLKGQTGSSTMPHKRNPANFENIISLSKQVLAQSVNANLNLPSEHQRDLTDSASSRFYTIAFATIAVMATRLQTVMNTIEVDEEAMKRNLSLSSGAIATEPLYLLFEKYGHTTGHEKTKELTHQALTKKQPLINIIKKDKEALAYWQKFTTEEKRLIEQPEKYYTGQAAEKAKLIAKQWRKHSANS